MEPHPTEEASELQASQAKSRSRGASIFSTVSLIVANLIPLYGAIFLGWAVFDLVVLYWLENVIIWFLNPVRMAFIPTSRPGFAEIFEKVFLIVFFLFHYGIFTVVHGVFVFSLFGDGHGGFKELPALLLGPLKWAFLALIASHFISFFFNFLGRQENRKTTVSKQMGAPYPRMMALHVAIILGAAAIDALNAPLLFLLILVIGKTIVDLTLHLRSHRVKENAANPSGART